MLAVFIRCTVLCALYSAYSNGIDSPSQEVLELGVFLSGEGYAMGISALLNDPMQSPYPTSVKMGWASSSSRVLN